MLSSFHTKQGESKESSVITNTKELYSENTSVEDQYRICQRSFKVFYFNLFSLVIHLRKGYVVPGEISKCYTGYVVPGEISKCFFYVQIYPYTIDYYTNTIFKVVLQMILHFVPVNYGLQS